MTGSGRLTSRTIDLPGVASVVVGANFVVHVKTGSVAQATITMDDNLTDRVEANVNGGELRLWIKPGMSVRNATLRAEVTVGQLDRLAANGASQVTLTSQRLQLDVNGTSAVSGAVAVDHMQASVSGVAHLGLSGQMQDLRLDVTGASQLPLADLTVRNLDVTLAGASHVTVTDTLSAKATGASVLHYRGSPRIIHEQPPALHQ